MVAIRTAYRSQIYKVEQDLHETAYWDSAIRNEFQQILVSIDQCTGAAGVCDREYFQDESRSSL